jgi:hypothetical protein
MVFAGAWCGDLAEVWGAPTLSVDFGVARRQLELQAIER